MNQHNSDVQKGKSNLNALAKESGYLQVIAVMMALQISLAADENINNTI